MRLEIEIERETDGRWIAEVPALPGVMAYGETEADSIECVQDLARRVVNERLAKDEAASEDQEH